MHLLLTDVLACPRCGPEFGLIVLADEMDDRLVVEGRLGCANCREEYVIRGGVTDLRVIGRPDAAADPRLVAGEDGGDGGADGGSGARPDAGAHDRFPAGPADDAPGEERAFRTAALLGIGQGMGTALVLGASPDLVERLDALLPNAQVVGGGRAGGRAAGAGWILHGPRLPFRDRSLRGIAVLGAVHPEVVGEAARTLAPGARLVLDPAPEGSADLVGDHGFNIILQQDGVLVASAPAPG